MGTFSDGSTLNVSSVVAWSSTPPGLVSISGSGLATAQATGTSTLLATSGSITARDTIAVSPPVVISIAVLPTKASVAQGFQQLQFTAMGMYSDGSQQDITQIVAWAAAPSNVASIDASGLATTLAVGTSSITAGSNSVTGAATLNVTAPILAKINYFTNANTTGIPSATVNLSNPDNPDICEMIYVFDRNEAMSECCGCSSSVDGLRTLSLNTDLTGNPLTGVALNSGLIKIVPADISNNPSCDPAAFVATGQVDAWSSHFQNSTDVTESEFRPLLFSSVEQSFLQDTCAAIKELGSGQGTCTCGSGS